MDDAAGEIIIDLGAIRCNFRRLKRHLAESSELAAVVKANAYGLGAERVVPVLADEGCRIFFVTTTKEAVVVRGVCKNCTIYVFNGITGSGDWKLYSADRGMRPVLNDLNQVDQWIRLGGADELAVAIQLDTGMTRYGVSKTQLLSLKKRLNGRVVPSLLMSHLACADDEEHWLNSAQLKQFREFVDILGLGQNSGCPLSLANSSGLFLGEDYHFAMVRAGAALYGINPQPGKPNKMAGVLQLRAKATQVRFVDSPTTVGYGATHHVNLRTRIATVPVGYADGFLRALGGRASAYVGDTRVPVVGRVSMDAITLDISGVPEAVDVEAESVEIIGPRRPVDVVASEAGTIGYELLARISHRQRRVYIDEVGRL
ncbi:MAG: alanine racemase [Pseudomonadota bacterium]|nr:alanine racemase [Pseudomonadota bacterium]